MRSRHRGLYRGAARHCRRRAHRTRPPRRRAPAGAHAGLSARAPGRRNAAPAAAGLRPGRHRHGPAGRQSGRAAVPVLRSRRGPARQCAVLAGRRGLRRAPTPDAARELVAETLRTDPPIHNTRRFADEISVDGQRIAAGQTVLLVLAAAASRNPTRPGPLARWATPVPAGLARRHAAGALAHLLRAGADAPALAARHRYRPLPNARLPCLTAPRTHTHDRRDLRSRTRPGRSQALSGHRRHPDRRAEGHRRLHFRRALPEPEHAGQAAVAVVLAR